MLFVFAYMKDVMIIRDLDVAKMFFDDTRRRILHLLKIGEHSATELARFLGISLQAVSYHLKLLEKHGLIEVSKTVKRRNLVEKYYRASAKIYVISCTLAESRFFGSHVKDLASLAIETFGLKCRAERFSELLRAYFKLRSKALEDILAWRRRSIERGLGPALEFLAMMRMVSYPEFDSLVSEFSKIVGGDSDGSEKAA